VARYNAVLTLDRLPRLWSVGFALVPGCWTRTRSAARVERLSRRRGALRRRYPRPRTGRRRTVVELAHHRRGTRHRWLRPGRHRLCVSDSLRPRPRRWPQSTGAPIRRPGFGRSGRPRPPLGTGGSRTAPPQGPLSPGQPPPLPAARTAARTARGRPARRGFHRTPHPATSSINTKRRRRCFWATSSGATPTD